MTAATLNLEIECGADFAQTVTLKDSSDVAIDITTYSFSSMIKSSAADPDALISFTVTKAVDPLTGTFTLSLTNAQTASLFAPGDFSSETMTLVYDVVQTVGIVKTRIIQGSIAVYPGVTL